MRWFSGAAAVLAVALLAGCTTTKQDFEAGRQIVGESPSARKLVLDKCVRDARSLSASDRSTLAAVMRTPEARVPPLLCRRVLAAMVSGRLSYEEARNIGSVPEAKLIRIIQGR